MAAPVVSTPSLYNAALSGMLGGLQAQRANTTATATDFNAQVLASQTFAVALDTSVGVVASLTTGANATALFGSAANAVAGETLPTLMQSLCQGYWMSRSLSGTAADTTAATYTTAVAAIKAAFTQAITQLSIA